MQNFDSKFIPVVPYQAGEKSHFQGLMKVAEIFFGKWTRQLEDNQLPRSIFARRVQRYLDLCQC